MDPEVSSAIVTDDSPLEPTQLTGSPASISAQYSAHLYEWVATRDGIQGESAVKFKNELYLPMPSGMRLIDQQAVSQQLPYYKNIAYQGSEQRLEQRMAHQHIPSFHPNAAYAAYLSRALYPELSSFILRGLLGLAGSEDPMVTLPKSMEYLIDKATPTGLSLTELYAYILSEVLTTGRLPLMVDTTDDNSLLFVPYTAEHLVNWKSSRKENSSETLPTMLVFEEITDAQDLGLKDDSFDTDSRVVQRVPRIDGPTGVYVIDKYIEGVYHNTVVPNYRGQNLFEIPVVVYGSISNNLTVDPSPLFPIANTSVHIYMKNADLSQAEFMTCNPTLIISGISPNDPPKAVGATVSLILPDPDAKAYYTKTDTSGLDHVLTHIGQLYEQAIYQGAQLLDSSKKAAEAAETVRLKQTASGATLLGIVRNIGRGVEKQLKSMAVLMGENPDEVSFRPTQEFMTNGMSPSELTALVASWAERAISHSTLLENFRKAGLLKEGESVEDELATISSEPPREIPGETTNESEETSEEAETEETDEEEK
jgi:hypothetical protein